MGPLFWKIFLWFWLAMSLLMLSLIWGTSRLLERDAAEPIPPALLQRLERRLQREVDTLQQIGPNGLRPQPPHHHQRLPLLILTPQGEDLRGRPLPPEIRASLNRPEFQVQLREQTRQIDNLLARRITAVDGAPYTLLIPIPPHLLSPDSFSERLLRQLRSLQGLEYLLLLAVVISGLVCFALARYISQPIRQLQLTTQQLAGGDWEARVPTSVSHRLDEIGHLGADFNQMATKLQQLLDAQQQLLRDVSHELRTPLARLQVALVLAEKKSAGKLAELSRMEAEIERLNQLIGQVISLSRLESLRHPTLEDYLDLPALLETMIENANFEAKPLQRCAVLEPGEAVALIGNGTLLYSALENIIRNGLRYTPADEQLEVSYTLDPTESQVSIQIRDHGPGVPAESLETLFEPFVRVSAARERESGGFGLGLAIAKRAVELHGGQIEAENCETGGLQISISLPLQTDQESSLR